MALAAALPERVCSRHSRLTRMQRFDMIGMRASPEKLPPLARFIRYLAARGLVEFGPPLAAGEDGLAVVDRIQQYAFVALYYGLDMGFDFTMCRPAGLRRARLPMRCTGCPTRTARCTVRPSRFCPVRSGGTSS